MTGRTDADHLSKLRIDYRAWKLCLHAYEHFSEHVLQDNSLTAQWLPGRRASTWPGFQEAALLLGTQSSEQGANALLLAQLRLPELPLLRSEVAEAVGWSITGRIPMPAEVNRARCMPGSPHLVAVHTAQPSLLLADWPGNHAAGCPAP